MWFCVCRSWHGFWSGRSNPDQILDKTIVNCVHNTSKCLSWSSRSNVDGCKSELKRFPKHHNDIQKHIERHTTYTIVSWPNPKQWVIVHTSDLMMIIRQSIYILSIITREMGKLKTHSPTYCMMDNWEDMLNLTQTLKKYIWQAFYKLWWK